MEIFLPLHPNKPSKNINDRNSRIKLYFHANLLELAIKTYADPAAMYAPSGETLNDVTVSLNRVNTNSISPSGNERI